MTHAAATAYAEAAARGQRFSGVGCPGRATSWP
jgi:hypothetical protein